MAVHQKLFAERCAAWGKDLTTDIRAAAAVMTTVILPGHHIATARQTRHRRIMLTGRLPGIDLKLFRLTRQRQLAVAEPNRLDTAQRIRAVVAVRRIDIGNRACIRIQAVIGHHAGELGNVNTFTAVDRVIAVAADEHIITATALQRIVAAGTIKDVGAVGSLNRIGAVITRTGDRIRTAEIQFFDVVTQGIALARTDDPVGALGRRLNNRIVGTVDRIGIVAGTAH